MFHILCWIIFGFIVGQIAKILHPGDDNLGFWKTTGVGIAGSFMGGVLNLILHFDNFKPAGILMSILGGIICCAFLRYYKLKNSTEGPKSFFTGKKLNE